MIGLSNLFKLTLPVQKNEDPVWGLSIPQGGRIGDHDVSPSFTGLIDPLVKGLYLEQQNAIEYFNENGFLNEKAFASAPKQEGFMPYKRQKSSFQPYRRIPQDFLTSPIILPPIIPRVIKPKAVTPNKVAKRLQVVSPSHVDSFFKSLEAHPGTCVFQCKQCGYMTVWKSALTSHMKIHRSSTYECVICNFKTRRKQVYKAHMKGHKGFLTYRCHYHKQHGSPCKFTTRGKYQFYLHLRKHKRRKCENYQKTYHCRNCKYSTFNRKLLIRHKHYRHPQRRPIFEHLRTNLLDSEGSSGCSSIMSDQQKSPPNLLEYDENTTQFYMTLHFGLFPYRCSSCSYITTDKSKLSDHMEKHRSSNDTVYKCPECTYCSRWKQMVITHMKTHKAIQERMFKCTVCDYETRHKNALTTHMRIHSDDRRYRCHICNYSAIQKVHLDVHMYKHNGVLPFKCSLCKYRTATKASLKAHMCTHTGVKPHKCEYCTYRSARKADLKKHVSIRHHKALMMQQIEKQ